MEALPAQALFFFRVRILELRQVAAKRGAEICSVAGLCRAGSERKAARGSTPPPHPEFVSASTLYLLAK